MPIFYISCHASIDMIDSNFEHDMPTFKIPESVFILNATSGGEYCIGGSELDRSIYNHYDQFHKLLVIDDIRDIPTQPPPEVLRYRSIRKLDYKQPFLSKLKRATNCEYPNFKCIFNEYDLGVYNISNKSVPFPFPFENSKSLLKQTQINPRIGTNDWFLKDVIDTIKSKNAIYFFGGCTVGAWRNDNLKSHLYSNIEKTTDLVQTMIYQADTMYSSKVPTMPLELLKSVDPDIIPVNWGGPIISTRGISNVVTTAKAMNVPLHTVVSKWGEMEVGEYEKAQKILDSLKEKERKSQNKNKIQSRSYSQRKSQGEGKGKGNGKSTECNSTTGCIVMG
jgi:hypothetical protein